MLSHSSSQRESIARLVVDIRSQFPVLPVLSKAETIAFANGDRWSVERIIEILAYRPWDEISFDDFLHCGADELKSYLTKKALAYYAPGLLTGVLNTLNVLPRTRLHEVSALMFLPTSPAYSDVWDYFGDGLFNDWGTPFFMQSTRELIEKIDYAHSCYTPAQRECIARHIEIVESYGVMNLNDDSSRLLSKFADFWRS